VRDNCHAYDVCTAFLAFSERPRRAAVYNLGGGRANSISVLEAITAFEALMGARLDTEYIETPRLGDHRCYISDIRRLRADYPTWVITRSLDGILRELARVGSFTSAGTPRRMTAPATHHAHRPGRSP
jgi:CDP-paratose 2-epimerase